MTEVLVDLPQLSNHAVRVILKECIKHILFMHGQLPGPYDTLQAQIEKLDSVEEPKTRIERRTARSNRSTAKRLKKFKNELDELLLAIDLALKELPSLCCFLILLGTSMTRPKEIYKLRLSGCLDHSTVESQETLSNTVHEQELEKEHGHKKALNQSCRKVIRTLISSGLPYKERGPLKLFMLLEAPANGDNIPGFLPKRGYSLKISNVEPITIVFEGKQKLRNVNDDSNNDSIAESNDQENEDDSMWYLCQVTVKGLRSETFGTS